MALDRHDPEEINGHIDRLGIDRDRLWLGVGAGFSKRPLTRDVARRSTTLRERVPGVRLVLAAMGPKMCKLAGSSYDGVFFNWMTPEFATSARLNVEWGAGDVPRDPPPVLGYVRVAVGEDARERLAKEESFYRDLHDGYRNHFDRLGEPEGTVGVAAADRDEAQLLLAAYTALDVTVVRGLASATVEAMSAVAEAVGAVSSGTGRARGRSSRSPRWRSPRSAGAAPKPPLAHQGHWFVDAKGRVVILHGVNMVYKVGSYRPADAGFGADDARSCAGRVQHRPARDHLQGPRAEAALAVGQAQLPPRLHPQHREDRVGARRAAASSASSTSTRTSTTSASRARAGPTGRCSTTASRPSRRRASPATTWSTPGLNRAFDNFWANARGRGPRPPGRLRRRLAARGDERSTRRPYVVGYDLLNEPWPGIGLQTDNCSTRPAARPSTARPWRRSTSGSIDAIRARRPRDPDLLRAAGHLRLRRRLQAPGHRRRRGGLLLPQLLPARLARRARLGPGVRAARGHGRSRTPTSSREETGDVPFLTEFGATDDLETIGRIVRLADDHMTSWQYWHYCACDDPTTSGPGVQALVLDAAQPPARRQRQPREAARARAPLPARGRRDARAATASTRRRAASSSSTRRGRRSAASSAGASTAR